MKFAGKERRIIREAKETINTICLQPVWHRTDEHAALHRQQLTAGRRTAAKSSAETTQALQPSEAGSPRMLCTRQSHKQGACERHTARADGLTSERRISIYRSAESLLAFRVVRPCILCQRLLSGKFCSEQTGSPASSRPFSCKSPRTCRANIRCSTRQIGARLAACPLLSLALTPGTYPAFLPFEASCDNSKSMRI